jgi:peroxiredoxin
MIATLKTRWRTTRISASQALRGGTLAAALLVVILLVSFRACAPSPDTTRQHINQPAIAFTLPAEQAGALVPASVAVTPTSGKPTLLTFFYTLCTHCLLEMRTAHGVAAQFPGLRSVYINSPAERPNIADLMMQRLAITDPVLLDDDGQVAAHYGVSYYPSFVLIDARGVVRDIWTGEVDAARLHAGNARALAASEGG